MDSIRKLVRQIIQEIEYPQSKIKFTEESRGYHHGQSDLTSYAELDGKIIGYIDYTIFENEIHIEMVKVDEQFQRQGIATKLFHFIRLKNTGMKIIPGYSTESGHKFFNSYKSKFMKEDNNNDSVPFNYKKWKRQNVTYRGMKELGQENGVNAMLGDGLYSVPNSNKSMAKQYGEVRMVVNGRPKNPIKFKDLNRWEIWAQQNLFMKYSKNGFPDQREFHKHTTIKDAILAMGYDGIEIIGREMVNFKPENILYFNSDIELENWAEDAHKFGNI